MLVLAVMRSQTQNQVAQLPSLTQHRRGLHKTVSYTQSSKAGYITSVHISFTFSSIMLQCLSKALTRPNNFLLFRQLINTCELLLTLVVSTDKGPVLKASSSRFSSSSTVGCVAIAKIWEGCPWICKMLHRQPFHLLITRMMSRDQTCTSDRV